MSLKKNLLCFMFLFLFSPAVFADIKLSADGQTRLRYEYQGNCTGLTNERVSFFRFRFSGGLKADFGKIATAYAKLTTESRSYIYNSGKDTRYNIDEAAIDNLFVLFPDISGLEIKAGRFDLPGAEYGEGFLLFEGSPVEGSRVPYINGLRLRYGNVELLKIYDTKRDFLPVINDRSKMLNSSTEAAVVVYGRFKQEDKLFVEPYYIHKDEYKNDADIVSVDTLGTFFKYKFENFVLRTQAAFQLNKHDGKTKHGFGGYVFADLPVANVIKPLTFGYLYLSGDNKDDTAAWNPLFSRYAWHSEIMALLYLPEKEAGYWTNLQLLKAAANFTPLAKTTITASYNYLLANETVSGAVFGNGKTRGSLLTCKLSYEISKDIKTYLLGEYLMPGDFYKNNAKNATFIRVELTAKI